MTFGLRSVGSARLTDVEAALRYGSHFVTARIEAALRPDIDACRP
nr:hypothetical protein [Mesorhizobium sp. BR1-1-7]